MTSTMTKDRLIQLIDNTDELLVDAIESKSPMAQVYWRRKYALDKLFMAFMFNRPSMRDINMTCHDLDRAGVMGIFAGGEQVFRGMCGN